MYLHNVCVLNSNLSVNILYLVTFTFKLAKLNMATKKKPHYLYSLSHMKAQFMFPARFLIDNFFIVPLERNYLYLTFKSKMSAVFFMYLLLLNVYC